MRPLAALWLAGCLAACRAAPSPSEPRAERAPAATPSELLPEDLDFVMRIDTARVRQNPALAGSFRDLGQARESELVDSIKAAFGNASAVWVGARWMSDGFHGDGVVAIEETPGGDSNVTTVEAQSGSAAAAPTDDAGSPRGTPHLSNARRVTVALPDVEVFERPAGARAEAVLEVVMRGRGFVLATAAEADAVLRVMRTGPDEGRLDPPARGLIAFAGRIRGAVPFDGGAASGMLRELTEGLIGYAGSLDEADAIEVEASLTYASAAEASRAAARAKGTKERLVAAGGIVGTMAHSVNLTEVGSSIRVRAAVPFAWLKDLH